MDKWTSILLTVKEMWEVSCEHLLADYTTDEYVRKRDEFKARRIYDLYGYEWFMKFIGRCPHIAQDFLPCNKNDGQCSMLCLNYKGGCSLCQ